ncbi:MAG: response regulator transcription factor [Lawsonibacter sp.]|nr:response regulator transcription factor [Lawsonibacter sp.]
MLTLCICDDSPEDTTQIRALADRFVQEHPELGLRTEFFSSPFDLLEHLDEKGGFDLYLLDILMPHMKGIELARRIRERGEPAELIFLTISREYALDAFEVDASGYLVKPVGWEKFQRALLASVHRLGGAEVPSFLLRTKAGLRKILFRELVMVESFDHDRVCTLSDHSKAVTADTLSSLMERLSFDHRFFSPHRAYIINLEHITALNGPSVTLSTGRCVPVSRPKLAALKKAYMDFLFLTNCRL